MASFRKRLASFFGVKKAASGPESSVAPGATSESPVKIPATVDKETRADSSNQPLQNQNYSAPVKPASSFENSELFSEVKANSAIAKAPWSGKLTSFQTGAWDHKSAEIGLFPAGAIEELNEAYVYIRLANRLVWLSEDLGRSSQDISENYLKMCKNVADRLDNALSLIAGEAVKQADQVQKPEIVAEKAQKPEVVAEKVQTSEATAIEKAETNQKPQRTAVEKAEQKQNNKEAGEQRIAARPRANKAEGSRAAVEPGVKKAERRKVEASPGAKAGVDEEYDQLFQGITTLFIDRDAQVAQINVLMNLLGEIGEIKLLSSGGAAGQRSWVVVSTEKALPLLQILRKIPAVKKVTKQGKAIEVSLTAT